MDLLARILAAQTGPVREEVPEWGFPVWVLPWTIEERQTILRWHGGATPEEREREMMARVVALSIADGDGTRVFGSHEQVLELRGPAIEAGITRLGILALDLNGLRPESEDTKSRVSGRDPRTGSGPGPGAGTEPIGSIGATGMGAGLLAGAGES